MMNPDDPKTRTFHTNRGELIEIFLQDSYVMVVTWSLNRGGYPVGKIGGKTYYLHKLIADAMKLPKHLLVDHIDRNRRNNRRDNLRSATFAQSNQNRGPSRNAPSRFKGVRRWNWGWAAYFRGVRLNLFPFLFEEEAAIAYDDAAFREYGDHAWLNFPDRFRNRT